MNSKNANKFMAIINLILQLYMSCQTDQVDVTSNTGAANFKSHNNLDSFTLRYGTIYSHGLSCGSVIDSHTNTCTRIDLFEWEKRWECFLF